MTAMTATDPSNPAGDIRGELVEMLLAARAVEREIFRALQPIERDAPAADGGWSAKDIQAHLSAWRRHHAERLAALRDGHHRPDLPAAETDATNAAIHAERAEWSWERVVADADAATDLLITEIRAAAEATITQDRIVGTTLGNGPEHDLAHLPAVAARVHRAERVAGLAATVESSIVRGLWPSRSAAFARYNLACYHALGGRLDSARDLLRLALPGQPELQELAPVDEDLAALHDEIPTLIAG
jgi:hypothetical protein